VADRDRGTFTRLTHTGHNFAPVWSPDGAFILFSSHRDGGAAALYRQASSGVGNAELVLKGTGSAFAADWAPNGQSILYAHGGGLKTGADIWSLRLGDGEPAATPVIRTPFFEGLAKFSPDGRWIAHESDESGRPEVYVQPYPESTGKWRISTDGGLRPRWARSGRELFYLKDDGTLMVVDVLGDESAFKAGTPRALFKTNTVFSNHAGPGPLRDMPYDVTRDGQQFLFTERLTGGSQPIPITVVLNWTAALEN
jgi:Tol biopolymer transport system component